MCIIQIFESLPHHVELVGSTTSQIVIPADSNQRQLSYHRFLITFAVIAATYLFESGEDLILADGYREKCNKLARVRVS